MSHPPTGGFNPWNRAISVAAVIAAALLAGGCGGPQPDTTPESKPRAESADPTQGELRRALDLALAREAGWNRRAQSEEDPAIEEHLELLRHELEPEEAAARMWALGNLLQQKRGDHESAASYYELLIQHHPEWEGIAAVYRALIGCYTALGDHVSARNVYRRILEDFPEDSEEYRVAEEALKR